ncbi:hypothetical protein [Knoellia flava]|uniref:hypothetical protein n=1 Tax=Knoellia flava TaxID=913969 RepID=UPI0012EC8390|nr:hypothetical protein [Knoellia flava]
MTATTSLARALRESQGHARPVATLVDLLVMPGLPGEMRLGLEGFSPAPTDTSDAEVVAAHEESIRAWQRRASGRRLRTGIEFDQVLRETVRETAAGTPAARALVSGRREFARSVHSLVMSGFRPSDFEATDEVGRLAVETWARAEQRIPALASPRDDLWIDGGLGGAAPSGRAADVTQRLLRALDVALGSAQGSRLVVHHGFYFFTPPQWALFRLLRELPGVDQLFVVHDDGQNPAFETWRRFFDPAWGMPVPTLERTGAPVSAYAAAFRDALAGTRVDPDQMNRLTVLDCRSPAELVRAWAMEDERSTAGGTPGVRRYAADAATVERYAARLGRGQGSAANLAQLPIGAFLLGMHDCIVAEPGARPTVRLSAAAVADVLGSGFLEVPGDGKERLGKRELLGAFRRGQEFFAGCREGHQWAQRAELLRSAVSGVVARHGGASAGESDVARVAGAAGNPLRLAPWADLRPEEAEEVADAIAAIVRFAESLVVAEEMALGKHLEFIRKTLRHGLANVDDDVRAELEAKVSGFSAEMDSVLDVEGLVDIVTMLLGRSADFDVLGEAEDVAGPVSELRALDEIGLSGIDRPVHVANLSDAAFPATRSVDLWPFRLEDHRVDPDSPVAVGAELLGLREETSALSDLYLMWLVLDACGPEHGLTISWISEVDGEHRNLSPLAALLLVPEGVEDEVKARAGGLQPTTVTGANDFAALRTLPVPLAGGAELRASAKAKLHRHATASAQLCPRRFALQWLVGPTSAYGPAYLQEAAYGNVQNALVRLGMDNAFSAIDAVNTVWRHLTPGQRASSSLKARVTQRRASADPAWVFTLKGRKNGTDAFSRAYAAARGPGPTKVDLGEGAHTSLPEGVADAEVCKFCPVQGRCLGWTSRPT